MAKNKIVYGNETLIDLTEDTVSSENLLSGATTVDQIRENVVSAELDLDPKDVQLMRDMVEEIDK